MLSKSNSSSLTSSPLKIIKLSSLVFFWENVSFSSYQRGKIKIAYNTHTHTHTHTHTRARARAKKSFCFTTRILKKTFTLFRFDCAYRILHLTVILFKVFEVIKTESEIEFSNNQK